MFDPRLDPACPDARRLTKTHADQRALLQPGAGGQLATVIGATQTRQRDGHVKSCARCRAFEPHCIMCGYDPRFDRHGWLCPAQTTRWRDLFPWNWRARVAPSRGAPARVAPPSEITRATPRADATASAPTRAHIEPRVPTWRQDPASTGSAAKAPARPSLPAGAERKRAALTEAYAALGVPQTARQEDVRAAFRELAMQYHPDKVATMAPEFRELAERKMTRINTAYEMIEHALRARDATPGRNGPGAGRP